MYYSCDKYVCVLYLYIYIYTDFLDLILFAKHVMSALLSHSYPEDLFYMHFLHIFR